MDLGVRKSLRSERGSAPPTCSPVGPKRAPGVHNCLEMLKWIDFGSADYEQMLELREEVLRKPLGMVLDRSKLDAEKDAQLLTYWIEDTVVGCMTLFDDGNGRARMRAVAVSPSQQGRGIGAMMVGEFERRAVELGFTVSFAHARLVALPFYLRLGYQTVGNIFEEVSIPHQAVLKVVR